MPPHLLSPLFFSLLFAVPVHAEQGDAVGPLVVAQSSRSTSFTWNAPAQCPTEVEMRDRLLALAGPGADHSGARAEVTEQRSDSAERFKLIVETTTDGVTRRRELTTATCALAAEAAVLFVVMSEGVERASPAAASSAPLAPTPREAAPSAPAAPREEPPRVSPQSPHDALAPRPFGAGLVAGVTTGALPAAASSFGGVVTWRAYPILRLEIDGTVSPSQTQLVAAGAGGSLALVSFGARACAPWRASSVEVALCAGVSVDAIHGHGLGASIVHEATSWWWGPEAGLAVRWSIASRVGLRAAAFADVPLARQRFVIDEGGVVDQPAKIGIRVAFGPEVLF